MAEKVGMQLSLDGEREYKSALKEIVQETKTLNAQMKEVSSAFDDEARSLEANQKQTDLLKQKKENLERQLEMMTDRLEALQSSTEDTSMAESRLEEQIAKVETQLNNTNSEIEAHQSAIEDLQSPMGELESTIDDQISELDELKEAYVNAYLEFGSTSDEAQSLAQEISTLSGELANNQSELDAAKGAADGFDQTLDGIGIAAQGAGIASEVMGSMFGTSFDTMKGVIAGGGILDLLEGISGAVKDLAADIVEAAQEWDQSCENIAIATGATADELERMAEASQDAYEASRNMNMSESETAQIYGEVATLFGGTEKEIGDLTLRISEYMAAAGESRDQTENLYSIMQAYSSEGRSMAEVTDLLTVASQNSQVGVDELSRALIDGYGSFQQFGMGMDDALNFMTRYAQAGGDVTNLSRVMMTAVKNLSREGVEDIPGAFNKAIDAMGQYNTISDALNAEIEGTGLKVSDVFGDNGRAQKVVQWFLDGKFAAEDYSEALRNSNGAVDSVMEQNTSALDKIKKEIEVAKSEAGTAFYGMTESFLEATYTNANGMAAYVDVSKGFNQEIAEAALAAGKDQTEAFAMARSAAELDLAAMGMSADEFVANWDSDAQALKENIPTVNIDTDPALNSLSGLGLIGSQIFSALGINAQSSGEQVSSATENAQATATAQMGLIGTAVTNLTSKWKGDAATISNTKPNLDVETQGATNKLSSFLGSFNSMIASARANSNVNVSVSGRLPIISAVKDAIGGIMYSISGWQPFARGYDEAMLINSPTIFGVSNGVPLLAGDRAGAEVVVGEAHLMNMFTNAVREAIGYVPAAGASSTTHNYGAVNVNVYGAPGQDVRELADLVSKQINQAVDMRRAI